MKREALAGLFLAISVPAAKAAAADLQLDVYTAPAEGLGVTSTLISGPTEAIRVDAQLVQVVRDLQGDAKDRTNSYLWVPSAKAEVAGDIVFQRTHVWLAESTPKTRKAWLASLRELESRHAKAVVAGHKRSPDSPDSPGAIKFTGDYIRAFEKARASSHSADELITKMKQKYADLALE